MKNRFMLYSPADDLGGAPDAGGGGEPQTPPATPPANNSIYGDLKVNWPEGTEETLTNEPSIKPFVDEKGNIRVNSLLKSYHETKKSFGKDKVILPTDKSTKEELDEFYKKLNGYDPEIANYKLTDKKDSVLEKGMIDKLVQLGHTNRLPPQVMDGFREELEKQMLEDVKALEEEAVTQREAHIELLKKEWGEAYDTRIIGAKNLIKEYLSEDAELIKSFEDPSVGRNPIVIRILGHIASKLYKEGKFAGGNNQGTNTSQEVADKINDIMGNKSHPYHDHNHPNHQKATAEMLELFHLRAKSKK